MLKAFQEAPLHFDADHVDEAEFAYIEAWKHIDVSRQHTVSY